MNPNAHANVDAAELDKFNSMAQSWWDPRGSFRPLHELNPLRMRYIAEGTMLGAKNVADIGCGGGILSEALCKAGARVTAIDLARDALDVAKLHALEGGLRIDYRAIAVEELAAQQPAAFDVVTCMEMLEHVPEPASTIAACAQLARPGGMVIFSTINRNAKSYLFAVIGAEYVLKLLPRGTHDYARFLKPAEIAASARRAGLAADAIIGMTYNPLTRAYRLEPDTTVNYIATFRRDA